MSKDFMLYGLCHCGSCGGRVSPYYHNYHVRKDGTKPRYYACHWRVVSRKNLQEVGREKCTLPIIPAQQLEQHVYNWLLTTLVPEEKLAPLTATHRWDQKIQASELKIAGIRTEIKRYEKYLASLDSLLFQSDFDPSTYPARENSAKQSVRKLELELQEARAELNHWKLRQEEELLFLKFGEDNKDRLERVREILVDLPFEQKQKLLRGMLSGPVKIGPFEEGRTFYIEGPEDEGLMYLDDDENDPSRPVHWTERIEFSFRYNLAILQDIIDNLLPPDGGGGGAGNSCNDPDLYNLYNYLQFHFEAAV